MPAGDQVVYQMQDYIGVTAELLIEAGVAIEFQQQAGIDIKNGGTIIGNGTESETILMTGTLAKRGWWNSVYVSTPDLQNSLTHTIVEHGGRDNGCVTVVGEDGNEGLLELSNCRLRRSGTYGLTLGGGAALRGDSGGNTYTGNRSAAVSAQTRNIHTLSADSTYTDNDGDYVLVESKNVNGEGPDETQRTWAALDVPYRIQGDFFNVNNLELVIEPGAVFEFSQGTKLFLQNGTRLTWSGVLEDGTVEPIVFTGTDEQRGWWDGIVINTSDNNNLIEQVIVEYGGGDNTGNITANPGPGEASYFEMTHCTLRQSGEYGMYINSTVELDLDSNEYTGNAAGPARIETDNMQMLSGDSTFQGNDNDYVLVSPRNTNGNGPDETELTWDTLDVAYRLQGDAHQINNLELVIEPGAVFEFSQGTKLILQNGTRLTWSGVLEDGGVAPIVFTGTDNQRGWWDGIKINTADNNNLMEEVIVEYGGDDLGGNIEVGSSGIAGEYYLEMSNCRLRRSEGYGMYVVRDTELELDSNEYTENTDGPARIETDNMQMLSGDSTFQGNDNDSVFVSQRNVNGQGAEQTQFTWDALDVPYRMQSDEHQINNVEVTVEPGAIVEFDEGGWVNFQSDSRFIMDGTQSDPITFRANDTGQAFQGWWQGILVRSTSLVNQMLNVVVENGGSSPSGSAPLGNVHVDATNDGNGQLTLENSTLADSGGPGVYVASNATTNDDICSVNTFENNAGGDCVVEE